jgi:SPP1 family predicted phage head-tail adaptor
MIGQLKHRARLEAIQKQDNGRGGWTESPVFVKELWCAHYRITTKQILQYRQADVVVDNKFLARYDPDIKENDRLIVGGQKYRIVFLSIPVDRTEFMEIFTVGEGI